MPRCASACTHVGHFGSSASCEFSCMRKQMFSRVSIFLWREWEKFIVQDAEAENGTMHLFPAIGVEGDIMWQDFDSFVCRRLSSSAAHSVERCRHTDVLICCVASRVLYHSIARHLGTQWKLCRRAIAATIARVLAHIVETMRARANRHHILAHTRMQLTRTRM